MNSLDSVFTGKNRLHFSKLESTNTYALSLLSKTTPPEGTCITSDYQTGGIGQYGRSWQSTPHKNLLVSYIFYPHFLLVKDQFLLNMVSSLAVMATVRDFLDDVSIKWPNDIYTGNRKIAGILIQNMLRNDRINATVIGVGLNINQTEFDPSLPNPTSIMAESGRMQDVDQILNRLSAHIEKYWLMLRASHTTTIRQEYLDALYLKAKWADFIIHDEQKITARISGITREGRLQLENEAGLISDYSLGEVRLVV